jgi:hypothetical protein
MGRRNSITASLPILLLSRVICELVRVVVGQKKHGQHHLSLGLLGHISYPKRK